MAGIRGQAIKLCDENHQILQDGSTGNTGSPVRIAIIVDIVAQHREDAEIVHRFGHFDVQK
jgi:hypothetical protein